MYSQIYCRIINNYKRILLLVILLSVMIILFDFFVYRPKFSEQARQGIINKRQSALVIIGNDSLYVLKIMGKPNFRWRANGCTYYNYDLPPSESGQLTFTFDSFGQVIDKGYFEK